MHGQAVLEIDTEAMMEVLEQTEDAKMLGQEIRTALLEKLPKEEGSGRLGAKEELQKLFSLIDEDGSNELR